VKTIWKFPLHHAADEVSIDMPKGARILTVQMQGETPCLWAGVDPNAVLEARRILIMGTGHPRHELQWLDGDESSLRYIGTVQMAGGQLVYHFFEWRG
jgi:hypothetical protein